MIMVILVLVDVEIAVSLKYLRNFSVVLEMSLINCEISLILTWSANCAICKLNRTATFAIAVTKLYIPVVTLLT